MLANKRMFFQDEKGVVLLIGLLVLLALTLLSLTAFLATTTDLKITSNYKTGEAAFYVAEAGIEEARTRLWNNAAEAIKITDDSPTSADWQYYIGTSDNVTTFFNYDGANRVSSIQAALDYTVRIKHATNAAGEILYYGDSDGDGIDEKNTVVGENIYEVTSLGRSGASQKTIVMEICRVPLPNIQSAVYVEANTEIKGNATVSGSDACGEGSLPAIVAPSEDIQITTQGSADVEGEDPPIRYDGTDMDIETMIDKFKYLAFSDHKYDYTYDVTMTSWNLPSNEVFYFNMHGNDLKITAQVTGSGILLVEGDLELAGGFIWDGIVIVTDSVRFTGGGTINGALIAGNHVDADVEITITGNPGIYYCSSAIEDATKNRKLMKLSWKEAGMI